MNDGYVKTDPWRLVEDRFDPSRALSSESLFALGNGVMGGRANFEERYSGETLQGNYIGGVYYPDKTRVGWWKNGYPEYFAKVPNAAFWIGVDVAVDGEPLDLATVAEVKSFYRETDMRRSVLTRRMTVTMRNGAEVAVEQIPAAPGADVRMAACSGEDYKLLLTAAPEAAERLAADFRIRFGTPLHPIGRITSGPGLVWLRNGKPEPLDWHGFEHY